MLPIEVTRLIDDESADYVFAVELPGFLYRVRLSNEYCQKLTDGKVGARKLVEESFKFLLKHERPGSILREFELSQIAMYFPKYEGEIKKRLQTGE